MSHSEVHGERASPPAMSKEHCRFCTFTLSQLIGKARQGKAAVACHFCLGLDPNGQHKWRELQVVGKQGWIVWLTTGRDIEKETR